MLADLVVAPVGGVEIRTCCVEEVSRRKSPYFGLSLEATLVVMYGLEAHLE